MYFTQEISSDHFDCIECGSCINDYFLTQVKVVRWKAKDDTGYDLGIFCNDCGHDIMKELNGGNRREVVSG